MSMSYWEGIPGQTGGIVVCIPPGIRTLWNSPGVLPQHIKSDL